MKRLFALALPLMLPACAGAGLNAPRAVLAAPEVIRSTARYQQSYALAPGDMLEVIVDRMPELSKTATVRPDGMITIPRSGDLRVEGLTPMEAAAQIRQILQLRVIDPQVTVGVTNPREQKVFVAGEVGKPGQFALRDAPTAAAALILAGDPSKQARLSNVALIRLEADGHLAAHILKSAGSGQAGLMFAMQNVALQPGDILVVQESGGSQFARFLQNYVNAPLNGVASVLNPYVQFRLLQEINRD